MTQLPMAGAHILHVEDEMLIALEVESICRENGADEIVNVRALADAASLPLTDFDFAIVDLTLHGQSTLPLIEDLQSAGVPIIFMSGRDAVEVRERFPSASFIGKPFLSASVIDAATLALASRTSRRI